MADFTPVALGVKPPQVMSLSDMLNMANVAQQYQQAQKINPLAVQKAEAEVKTAQTGAEKSAFDLNQSYAQKARGVFGGFTNDPDFISGNGPEMVKKLKASQAFLKSIGVPSHPDGTTAQIIEMAEKDPKAVRRALINMTQGEMSAESKMTSQFPSAQALNTGSAVVPIQMGNKELTGVAPGTPQGLGIKTEIGPNQLMEPTGRTDQAGNPTAYVKDSSGNILGEVIIPAGVQSAPQGGQPRIPQGGQPAQPQGGQVPANAPVRMPYETPETVLAARNIQLKANEAARNVQSSQYNNNKIVELADKALVGANAETLAKLGGGFAAVPWTSDATQNRQILGHQMALETATLASGAGLSTDAARGLAEKMSGTTEWTPEAIKSTARMNRSLTTGTDMFNRGVNAAVAAAGNNPLAAREFQNKWSSQEQLLPTLQFVDALRNAKSDPAGAKAIIDSLGGYGSDAYKQMLQRAGKLNELITKGQ